MTTNGHKRLLENADVLRSGDEGYYDVTYTFTLRHFIKPSRMGQVVEYYKKAMQPIVKQVFELEIEKMERVNDNR